MAGVVAEVKRLREERRRLLADIAAKQQTPRPDPAEVEQLAAEMSSLAQHMRETYEDGSVEDRRALLRASLAAPDGGIGPVVLNFQPAQNGRRRHGEMTDGALYVRPVTAYSHRPRGGGSRIRTGG